MQRGVMKNSFNSVLYDYLLENYNGERWAIAESSANDAAPIILKTELPAMAIEGVSGNDSILTLENTKGIRRIGRFAVLYGFWPQREEEQRNKRMRAGERHCN